MDIHSYGIGRIERDIQWTKKWMKYTHPSCHTPVCVFVYYIIIFFCNGIMTTTKKKKLFFIWAAYNWPILATLLIKHNKFAIWRACNTICNVFTGVFQSLYLEGSVGAVLPT